MSPDSPRARRVCAGSPPQRPDSPRPASRPPPRPRSPASKATRSPHCPRAAVTAGETLLGSMTVEYAPAKAHATHAVVTELVFDDPYGVFDITTETRPATSPPPRRSSAPPTPAPHGVPLRASPPRERGGRHHRLHVQDHGRRLRRREQHRRLRGRLDLRRPQPLRPRGLHGHRCRGSADVKVNPVFYQDFDLAPTAAAVVISFTNPLPGVDLNTSGLAKPVDGYNNCRTVYDGAAASGVDCVITDFTDAKGQFLTLATA